MDHTTTDEPLHASREDIDTKETLAAEAAQAMSFMQAGISDRLSLIKSMGSIIVRAKQVVPHGQFGIWQKEHLNIGRQWISMHAYLFKNWEELQHARAWAVEQNHPLANRDCVEKLVRLVKTWRARKADPDNIDCLKRKVARAKALPATEDAGAAPQMAIDQRDVVATFDAILKALTENDVARVEAIVREALSNLRISEASRVQAPARSSQLVQPAQNSSALEISNLGQKRPVLTLPKKLGLKG